jgi:hypothetical protein
MGFPEINLGRCLHHYLNQLTIYGVTWPLLLLAMVQCVMRALPVSTWGNKNMREDTCKTPSERGQHEEIDRLLT